MNTRNIFLSIIIIFVASAIAKAQTIDSTQWPFPDSLVVSIELYGEIHRVVYDPGAPNAGDWTSPGSIPEPYSARQPYFTWRDAVVDTSDWHFYANGQLAENNDITLDLLLDTAHRKIDSLYYHHTIQDMFSIEGESNILITNLTYSQSGITFPDDDLYRHVVSAASHYDGGHSNDYWINELSSLDSLSIFGETLVPAFQAPSEVDFGLLGIGSSDDTVLKLRNVSNAPLIITRYALSDSDSGFMLFDTSLHLIPANDSGIIIVRFKPRTEQLYLSSLKIFTDEPYSSGYQINLKGGPYSKLLLPSYPTNFVAHVGETDKKYAELFNKGTAAAVINSIFGSYVFSVDSPKTPFSIPANDSSLFVLAFHPDSVGFFEETLTIASEDGSRVSLQLSGTGEIPSDVAPAALTSEETLTAFPTFANQYTKIFIMSPDAREGLLSILNLLGQEIASRSVRIDPGGNTEYFETSNFPSGTYFAQIETSKNVFQTRFIVEH